jgi:hypothetical protein
MERAVLQGVLIDEAIEMVFQCAGDFGRSTGARAIHQTLGALVGKAVDPFTQGSIGQVQRVGDRLEALPCDDVAHGLGTAEDTGLFRLLEHRLSSGQSSIRKLELKCPHRGTLSYKLLRKLRKRHRMP